MIYRIVILLAIAVSASLKSVAQDSEQEYTSLKEEFEKDRKKKRLVAKNERKVYRISKRQRRLVEGAEKSFYFDFVDKEYKQKKIENGNVTYEPGGIPPFAIHEMDAVSIHIINVNPFLYEISLYELQGDRISNENLSENNSSKTIALNFEPLTSVTFDKVDLAVTRVDDYKKINAVMTLRDQIATYRRLSDNIIQMRLNKSPDTVGLSQELSKFKPADLYQNLNTAEIELSSLKLKTEGIRTFEGNLSQNLRELQHRIGELNMYAATYNSLLYLLYTPNRSASKIKEDMLNLLHSLLDIGEPTKITASYTMLLRQIEEVMNTCYEQKTELVAMDDYQASLDNNDFKSKKSVYDEIGNKLDILKNYIRNVLPSNNICSRTIFLFSLVNDETFTVDYATQRIAENADYLQYRIEFKPTTLSDSYPQVATPYIHEFSVQIHEGFKVDLSSGFVLDLGLSDPSYYFDKTTDPSGVKVYVRKSNDSGDVTPSIAAFLNGYKRTSTNFKVGGAVGFGLSNNARFRLYLGPSCIIGRKERIVISAGVSFGAISRLANGYELDQEFENNASLPNEVPTVIDKFKFGGYFGLGFNLTGKANKSFAEKIKFTP